MKKTFLFGLIAAALGFAACSSEDDAILSQKPQKGMMTLNATVQQSVDTRATLNVSASTWAFDFANGDELKVTNSELTSGTYYTFTKGATDFASTTATPTSSPATWYAYFPSNTVTLTGQSGSSDDVANKYALVGTATSTTGSEGLNITMSAQVAILKIVNAGGSIDLNVKNSASTWVTGLEANNESFTVTTSTTKASLLTKSTADTYYVAVPAGVQLAIKNGDTVIKSTIGSGLVAGKYYTLVVGAVAWTNALSLGKSEATSISIETGIDVNTYSEDTNHKKLNTEGTLWEVLDGTTLRIQTPAQKIKGRNTASTTGVFRGYASVAGISGLGNLDMSDVTNMSYMFYDCSALTTLDLSSFNTAKVTDMRSMFYNCSNLTSLNLSSFDTSKVAYMTQMFSDCSKLNDLDISSFRTNNVKSMTSMFNGCSELTTLDLSSFDTSKVTSMSSMFNGCQKLTSLDLSSFNTSNVTDMGRMFMLCYRLASLKLSNSFTIASSKSLMFHYCGYSATSSSSGQGVIYCVSDDAVKTACKTGTNWSDTYMRFDNDPVAWTNALSLGKSGATSISIETGVDVSSYTENGDHKKLNGAGSLWEVLEGTTLRIQTSAPKIKGCNSFVSGSTTTGLFEGYTKVTAISGLDKIEMNQVTNMSRMFYNCNALTSLNLSSFNTSNVTDMKLMFYNCNALISLSVSSFNTSKVKDMSNMFTLCNALTSLDLSSFNTSEVTNMKSMFSNCKALESLTLTPSLFNTAKVTDMSSMFALCYVLPSLDLSWFNTEKVTTMERMFSTCRALTTLSLTSFNTANVTQMSYMFNECWALTALDVSSFNTEKVTTMCWMFRQCKSLTSLDLSNFKTSTVKNMGSMFGACLKLESLKLSNEFKFTSVTDKSQMFGSCGKELPTGSFCVIYNVDDPVIKNACKECDTTNNKFDTKWNDTENGTRVKFDGE